MYRLLPALLLSSCAILERPATYADALCLGGGFAQAKINTAPGALPGVELDLSQCFDDIDVTGPLTCEQEAQIQQWHIWTTAIEQAFIEELSDSTRNYKVVIPLIAPKECEQ